MTAQAFQVTANDTIIRYTSSGESAFLYDFPITDSSEIRVSIDQVEQTFGTDFTLTGVGDQGGGTVTITAGTTAGQKIVIWQDLDVARGTGFATGAAVLLGEDLNTEFVRQVRMDQQLDRDIKRCMRLAVDDPALDATMLFPAPATRRNRYLKFADTADAPLETAEVISNTLVTLTQAALGELLIPQTPAELAAGITPTNYFRDPGDIRRYGAVGDGTTNDTTAIQNALTLSASHACYIPPTDNFWRIQSQLTLPDENGATIIGSGDRSIIRQATASANGIRNNTGNRRYNITMRDFRIGVTGAISGGVGIDLEDISNSHFSNVKIIADDTTQGFRTGWRLYSDTGGGCFRNEFDGCGVRTDVNAAAVGVLIAGASGIASNSHHWRGGEIRADSGIGVSIPNNGGGSGGISNQNVIAFTSFEGTTATGIDVEGGSSVTQVNVFLCNRFEGVTTGIVFDASTVDNVCLGNFYTSGVTPITKAGENAYLDFSSNGALDNILDLVRGHYQVTNLRDTAVPGFHAPLQNAAHPAFGSRVTGDTALRIEIRADGQVEFGGGSAVSDVTLQRKAAGIWGPTVGQLSVNTSTVAGLPSASPAQQVIFVSDESGGAVLAFSDGTNWRRVTDRAVVT